MKSVTKETINELSKQINANRSDFSAGCAVSTANNEKLTGKINEKHERTKNTRNMGHTFTLIVDAKTMQKTKRFELTYESIFSCEGIHKNGL